MSAANFGGFSLQIKRGWQPDVSSGTIRLAVSSLFETETECHKIGRCGISCSDNNRIYGLPKSQSFTLVVFEQSTNEPIRGIEDTSTTMR